MAFSIGRDLTDLLQDPTTVKALATSGRDGSARVTFRDLVFVDDDGRLEVWEPVETSQTNRDLTYALWFGKRVSLGLRAPDGRSWRIWGTPVRALITGKRFEAAYRAVRERFGGDWDLSTVWLIEPEGAEEVTPAARVEREHERHPLIGHLDRF